MHYKTPFRRKVRLWFHCVRAAWSWVLVCRQFDRLIDQNWEGMDGEARLKIREQRAIFESYLGSCFLQVIGARRLNDDGFLWDD